MIQAISLSKKFQHISVFNHINLSISPGRIIALTGPNAIGKTTLLECLAGYKKLSGGKLIVNGKSVIGAQVCADIVYQKKGLFFSSKTTIESALHAFRLLFDGFNAAQALDLLGKWNIPLEKAWAELSLGQQQKAEFSFFISRAASCYIFDEPFANLDHMSTQALKRSFLQYLPEDSSCIVSLNHLTGMEGFFTDLWILKSAEELITIDLTESPNNDLTELYEEAMECYV